MKHLALTKPILKILKASFASASNAYIRAGRPLLPVTRLLRGPLKWYYHRSPLLRHDNKFYLRPWLLELLHNTLISEHPHDFSIYGKKLKFRSHSSSMAIHGYYVGEIEYHLLHYVISQIRPNFTMLDIGAHHGAYALAVAHELRNYGWHGKIYCFEPDPFNFSILQYNIQQNNLETYIVCQQVAIADLVGEQTLLTYPEENSANTLSWNTEMINQGLGSIMPQTVQTITIDSLIDQFEHINLIKLDIQGSEARALAGATQVIQRDRPIIVVEAVPGLETTRQTREYLLKQGYLVSGVTAASTLCPVDSDDTFVSWDWVGLPNK